MFITFSVQRLSVLHFPQCPDHLQSLCKLTCKAERRWGTRVPRIITRANVWSWSDTLSTVELLLFTPVWQQLCFECVCVCRSRACVHHHQDKHPAGPDAGGALAQTVSWCGQKADRDERDGDWKNGATRRRRSARCLFKRGLREIKYFRKMGKVIIELLSHVVFFFFFFLKGRGLSHVWVVSHFWKAGEVRTVM